MDLRGLKARHGFPVLLLIATVAAAALLTPYTLAWFSGRLTSGNRISTGGAVGVQLWAQTADSRFGSSFASLNGAAFTGDLSAALVREDGAGGACQYPESGRLYPLTSEDALSDAGSVPSCGSLFQDSGILPGDVISRRLIVRNDNDSPVSYLLAFSGGGADSLGEALRVDAARCVLRDGALEEEERFPPVDGNQLLSRTFQGALAPGGFEVYELRISFLSGAGSWYEGRSFLLDVEARTSLGGTLRPARTGAELQAVLDGSLADGDTVVILEDITVERFQTDRMLNLEIAAGKVLTVESRFAVIIPAGADGRDPFGTITVAYGEENGRLALDGCEIRLDAPRVAFRWNQESILPLPENCRVRALNGEPYGKTSGID